MKIGKINKVGCWSTSKLVIANLRNLHFSLCIMGLVICHQVCIKKNLQHFITQLDSTRQSVVKHIKLNIWTIYIY